MNLRQLTGQSQSHVVAVPGTACKLHRDALAPYLALRAAADRAGLDLQLASAFRDFDRQRAIWNAKYRGQREVQDARGRPVDVLRLAPPERVATLLLWLALPGASRHHWGSDIDVVDGAALAAGYRPRLERREFARGGPFYALGVWLEANMRRYGFFRPYREPGRGVQPEPWHLSYAPLARPALAALTPDALARALAGKGVEGEAEVLGSIAGIHRRYVRGITPPPRMRSRWARLSR